MTQKKLQEALGRISDRHILEGADMEDVSAVGAGRRHGREPGRVRRFLGSTGFAIAVSFVVAFGVVAAVVIAGRGAGGPDTFRPAGSLGFVGETQTEREHETNQGTQVPPQIPWDDSWEAFLPAGMIWEGGVEQILEGTVQPNGEDPNKYIFKLAVSRRETGYYLSVQMSYHGEPFVMYGEDASAPEDEGIYLCRDVGGEEILISRTFPVHKYAWDMFTDVIDGEAYVLMYTLSDEAVAMLRLSSHLTLRYGGAAWISSSFCLAPEEGTVETTDVSTGDATGETQGETVSQEIPDGVEDPWAYRYDYVIRSAEGGGYSDYCSQVLLVTMTYDGPDFLWTMNTAWGGNFLGPEPQAYLRHTKTGAMVRLNGCRNEMVVEEMEVRSGRKFTYDFGIPRDLPAGDYTLILEYRDAAVESGVPVVSTPGTSLSGAWPLGYPEDFAVHYEYWFVPELKNVLDTSDGYLHWELAAEDENVYFTADPSDLASLCTLLHRLIGIQEPVRSEEHMVEPMSYYSITFRMDGRTYTVTGDITAMALSSEYAPEAAAFMKAVGWLNQYMERVSLAQSVPPAVGYWD